MKVLYVDLEYDYGIKARGMNTIGQDGFKGSFEKMGYDVSSFYYDDFLANTEALQPAICDYADNIKPDAIFFCLYQEQFTKETLMYLKSKYMTVNWFGDDQWRFDTFTSIYANCFSWCITTDKYALTKYHAIGQKNVIYSQWAAIDKHEIPFDQGDYKFDVSFVGGCNPYRKWFVKELAKLGVEVHTFGHGWGNGSLSSQEMNQLFMRTKVNLNISNSVSLDIRYLSSSLRAFLGAMRKTRKNMSQMKARNFEIPFFHGFQLTDYVPSLEYYFEIGSEVTCYTSVEEAAMLIQYYLDHDDEREEMKLQGSKRANNEHGYIHRFENIFARIV